MPKDSVTVGVVFIANWLSSAAWFATSSSKATATGGRKNADALGVGWLRPITRLTWGVGLQEEQGMSKFRMRLDK